LIELHLAALDGEEPVTKLILDSYGHVSVAQRRNPGQQ